MPYDNKFRECWRSAGYPTDLGSCATGYPPPSDRVRLFHLCSAEHALDDVEKSRLKVARFLDLNDPFELLAINLSYGNYGSVRMRISRNRLRDILEDRRAFDATTGLLCFSEDWTSPVMWTHYAARHQGICLGFNVLRSAIKEVLYVESRIVEEFDESSEPLEVSDELRTTLRVSKCQVWAYERERRSFVPLSDAVQEDNLHFRGFGDEFQLAEVIVGSQCKKRLEEVREITAKYHPNVCVYKARMAFSHFKVVPLESSVP